MINIIAGQPNVVHAKTTTSFVAAGITAMNVSRIYEIYGLYTTSYTPGSQVNAIDKFTAGRAYIIHALQDIDLTACVMPPFSSPEWAADVW